MNPFSGGGWRRRSETGAGQSLGQERPGDRAFPGTLGAYLRRAGCDADTGFERVSGAATHRRSGNRQESLACRAALHVLAGAGRRAQAESGKRKGSRKAHRNRAGRMFCRAAGALAQSIDKALGGFYRRLRGRVGGLAANVALARKLALLFYRLLRHGMEYVEKGLKTYQAKVIETEARWLRKLARKQGFELVPKVP